MITMEEHNNPLDRDTRNTTLVQQDLPNSGGILAMGIISIVLAGLIGMILAIVALSQASKAKQLYDNNPGAYTATSMSRVNAGRICAIIGLSILGLAILVVIAALAVGR